MRESQDVIVNVPSEYFDALTEVIRTGLDRAKITTKERQNLKAWWDAEKEFARDDLR